MKSSQRNLRKFTIACLGSIVVLAAALSLSACAPTANYAPGQGKDTNIVNLWITEDSLVYLTQEGKLYQQQGENSRMLHDFPTHVLFHREETGELLYYWEGTVRAYDPVSNMDTEKIDLGEAFSGKCFLLGAGDNFFYLQHEERKRWKVHLDSMEKEETPATELLFSDEEWMIWSDMEGDSLVATNKIFGKESILLLADGAEKNYCISVCRLGDTLLYLRTDGILRHCPLPGASEETINFSKMEEALSREKVLAVAVSGNELICVPGEQEGNVCLTVPVVVDSSGSLRKLQAPGKPIYSVPGSCILRVEGHQYAYAVTTDERIIWEKISAES